MIESDKTPAAEPKRTGLLIWLIVSQLLALGSLVIWFVGAGMSLMSVDADGGLPAWILAVWCYPILPLFMSIGAWVAYKRHKNSIAAVLSGLSFAPIILFFLVINLI